MHTDRPPTIICLIPVRNEAWILERFLRCASLWADHIVVADQCSDDDSCEIALRYPKVTLIRNPSPAYDEGVRQRLLIDAARRLPAGGRRMLLALDADEFLTANWQDSAEWRRALEAAPGTILKFRWVNIMPGFRSAWAQVTDPAFGFMDDGSEHRGQAIHSARLPMPPDAPVQTLREVSVLHYQYVNWNRMKSKQRWYQCWERVNRPKRPAIGIYRQYHFMDALPPEQEMALPPEWLSGYEARGIDMTSVATEPFYRWDLEILDLIVKHGASTFRKLNVWDVDWNAIAQASGRTVDPEILRDPRTAFEKRIHRWLASTQARCLAPRVRRVQRLLRVCGW